MSCRRFLAAFLSALFLAPLSLAAQGFEGVVRQRTLQVDEMGVSEVLWGDGQEDPDFESEEDWVRHIANRLFETPVERWLEGVEGVSYEEMTVYMKGHMAMYEGAGSEGALSIIMDGSSGRVWMVNHEERSYVTFTPEEMQAATNEMLARMGIDPEEAAERVDALAERMGEAPEVPVTVRALGRSTRLNGFAVSAYEAVGGGDVAVAWCADDDAGIRRTMEEVFKGMAAWQDEDEEEDWMPAGPDLENEVCGEGLAIQTHLYVPDSTEPYMVDELLSVERESVADERFQVPEGYQRRELSDLWGGMGM